MNHQKYLVAPGKKVRLGRFDPADTGGFHHKKKALKKLEQDIRDLFALQERLYAYDRYALLVILQAMDAAGKDSVVKHVMSGLNPQGCRVVSFKTPSDEELDHDFLWRCARELPARGRIGLFNRSYYEELLIVRVHPEFLEKQKLPPDTDRKRIWDERYDSINQFERHLVRNGTHVVKFFLNVSRGEQKRRFLERIERAEKHWKFSSSDVAERQYWKDYMNAYEQMLIHTSTPWAPWHVIPADHKWFTQAAVGSILVEKLAALHPRYPVFPKSRMKELAAAKKSLMAEDQ